LSPKGSKTRTCSRCSRSPGAGCPPPRRGYCPRPRKTWRNARSLLLFFEHLLVLLGGEQVPLARDPQAYDPPFAVGVLVDLLGASFSASLTSTTSPPTGAYRSETALTDSMVPKASPAPKEAPSSGSSMNTTSPSSSWACSVMPTVAVSPSRLTHSWVLCTGNPRVRSTSPP